MTELKELERRITLLEAGRESDRRDAEVRRHNLANALQNLLSGINFRASEAKERVSVLDKSVNGVAARARLAWMQWLLGAAGTVILLMLGYLLTSMKGSP